MSRLKERRTMVERQIDCRLETPSMTGYRPGMSSPTVIGRKLGALYGVPGDRKREIEKALKTLDGKLG